MTGSSPSLLGVGAFKFDVSTNPPGYLEARIGPELFVRWNSLKRRRSDSFVMDGNVKGEGRKHTVGQSSPVMLCLSSSGDDGDRQEAEADMV